MGVVIFGEDIEASGLPASTGDVGNLGGGQGVPSLFDPVNSAFRASDAGEASDVASRLSASQIWRMILEGNTLRVTVVGGSGLAGDSRLSVDQILMACYDPVLHALRVSLELEDQALGARLSADQKIMAIYSKTDRALSAEFIGEGSGQGGSRLSKEQILMRVISSDTGKLQLVA